MKLFKKLLYPARAFVGILSFTVVASVGSFLFNSSINKSHYTIVDNGSTAEGRRCQSFESHRDEGRYWPLFDWCCMSNPFRSFDGHESKRNRATKYCFDDYSKWIWRTPHPMCAFDGCRLSTNTTQKMKRR